MVTTLDLEAAIEEARGIRGTGRGRGALVKAAGFVVHPGRPAAIEAARGLEDWLQQRGIETRVLNGDDAADEARAVAFARGLDLVVSVGGDGTFLRAALVASRSGVPVLGVKVGRMGFLTEVEPDQATALLERMLDGSARIEERLAVVAEGSSFEPQWALNEVIVEKSARHRLIRLATLRRPRLRDDVLGRRRHLGDADGLDGVLVQRRRPDRLAIGPVHRRDADRRAHGVRPLAGARAPTSASGSR